MPHEPPLSDRERARLAEIRRNRAIRQARAEIESADYWDGWLKLLGVLLVLAFLCWPVLVWHQPDSLMPTTTGWVMQVYWIVVLVAVPLIAVVIQKAKKH